MRADEDGIWDEFKWEEFMREQDKKVDRYMELFYRYYDHPDCDKIIALKMGWTWTLDKSNENLPQFPASFEDERGEIEEGDEWKRLRELDPDDGERLDVEYLSVYRRAKEFAARAMCVIEGLPDGIREDSSVVDFLSNALIAPAKVAGGTGIGDDIEELGGNIAYCKRGLAAANLAVAALHEMKEKGIIQTAIHLELSREAAEVRNGIALHILDLREKFHDAL